MMIYRATHLVLANLDLIGWIVVVAAYWLGAGFLSLLFFRFKDDGND